MPCSFAAVALPFSVPSSPRMAVADKSADVPSIRAATDSVSLARSRERRRSRMLPNAVLPKLPSVARE